MDYNINNSKVNSFRGVNKMNNNDMENMSFQDQVDDIISRVSERAEREVPEYGSFSPVAEYMPNLAENSAAGKYALRIYKMPKDVVADPKQRYIEAAVYMPAGDYKADMVVGYGHKDKIMEILNSPEFPEKLNRTYGELLELLEDQ